MTDEKLKRGNEISLQIKEIEMKLKKINDFKDCENLHFPQPEKQFPKPMQPHKNANLKLDYHYVDNVLEEKHLAAALDVKDIPGFWDFLAMVKLCHQNKLQDLQAEFSNL